MIPDSKSTGPRDVFLYLLHIILLYFCAINIGVLLYQFINIYFPDALTDYYFSPMQYYGPLRWAVATLTIGFPVYLWTGWMLEKEYRNVPEKREMKTRKWLLNFTLFASLVIIIGDFIALLYRYLEGDLTTRFGLKVLTVFLISFSVLYYYWRNLKDKQPFEDAKMKAFLWGVIGMVLVSVVSGFIVAGSPTSQRARRFDERRVSDLQSIQSQIIYFWQKKEELPDVQDELVDNISGYKPPVDPQSSSAYEYRKLTDLKFEICADFQTEARENATADPQGRYKEMAPLPVRPGMDPYTENWSHGVGRTCFERTIDPELYKQPDAKPI